MYCITSTASTTNGQASIMNHSIILPPAKGELPVTSLYKSNPKLSTFPMCKATLLLCFTILHLDQKVA